MNWVSSDQAEDVARRALKPGRSGRVFLLIIAIIFLLLGIYGHSIALSAAAGFATLLAAGSLIRRGFESLAERRLGRSGTAGDQSAQSR